MAQQIAGPNMEATEHTGRRPRMQVYCDILSAIESGVCKPTHILKKANLSWLAMTQYLLSLETKQMVTKVTGVAVVEYHITHKGRQLLNQYLAIQEDLKINTESLL